MVKRGSEVALSVSCTVQRILSSPYNCFPKLVHLFPFLFLFLKIKQYDLRQAVRG